MVCYLNLDYAHNHDFNEITHQKVIEKKIVYA